MSQLEDIELPEGDAAGSIHIKPASAFHPFVLLPGDPARAMEIATDQLTAPRMFNHRRGLWGYSGQTPGGTGFLIQSTGMGGPSAAIVAEELCDMGAEILVRVGTCGAIAPGLRLGDLVIARRVIAGDGTSRALAAPDVVDADAALTNLLAEHAGASGRAAHTGIVASVDLFYDPHGRERNAELAAAGALAVEMEAAAVLSVAARRGVRAACLLGVSDELQGDDDGHGALDGEDTRLRLPHDDLVKLGRDLGRVAIAAVGEAVGAAPV